jgi:hypothetical protein
VSDTLYRMLDNAAKTGYLKYISLGNDILLFNLYFGDDTLLFLEAS